MHESFERFCHLRVVTLLSRLTEFVWCTLTIDASDDVVELRSGENTKVCVFDLKDIQSGSHSFDQGDTRRACVAAKDHPSGPLVNLPQLIHQLFVDKLLVCSPKALTRGVGKSRGITFPALLRHVSGLT